MAQNRKPLTISRILIICGISIAGFLILLFSVGGLFIFGSLNSSSKSCQNRMNQATTDAQPRVQVLRAIKILSNIPDVQTTANVSGDCIGSTIFPVSVGKDFKALSGTGGEIQDNAVTVLTAQGYVPSVWSIESTQDCNVAKASTGFTKPNSMPLEITIYVRVVYLGGCNSEYSYPSLTNEQFRSYHATELTASL